MNPLKTSDLSGRVPAVGTFNDRVRARLKTEKDRRRLSERDLAGVMNWSQSRVSQKLSGRTPITLDELETLCFAVSLSPAEAVRDQGLEFCAEMTPTELRLFERLRALTPAQRDAIMTILNVAPAEPRRALPPKPAPGPRPRR